MRKVPFAAGALVASVALTFGASMGAEARTINDLKVCWLSPDGTSYPMKVAVDGPTSRSASIANGTCQSWNVLPGRYKVFAETITEVEDTFAGPDRDFTNNNPDAICGPVPAGESWEFFSVFARVKRFKNTHTQSMSEGRGVQTRVQNNRLTSVNIRLVCDSF